MRRTVHRREKPQPDETGGFRFAVTLLAAFGTVSYAGYNYLQNTPVDPYWYWLVCRLTAVAGIFVLGLLLYTLIKGYSMEVQDSNQRVSWAKRASYIYLGVFSIFIMLLLYIFASFFLGYVIKTENSAIKILLSIIIAITAGSVFFLPLLRQSNNSKSKEKEIELQIQKEGKFFVPKAISGLHLLRKKPKGRILNALLIAEVMLFCFLILLENLFPTVLYSPLQGHVTVDMESVYYQNVSQIPVLIHVTGPNTGLSIYLVKESNNTLYQRDNITLIPEHNYSNKTVSGEQSILIGNTLDYGKYNVFINTTDLSSGYYELVCMRWRYEKTYGVRGFYLLNSSQQSCIKE
jgi:hypothetical protein